MSEIKIINIQFQNNINEIIDGDIRIPKNKGKYPLIIISHGFRAWKDWGFNPFIAEELCKSGAITLIFNFSLNGRINNPNKIDIEKFSKNSVSRELEDLDNVISYFLNSKEKDLLSVKKNWDNEIILLGMSLGAAISILKSASDKRIKKLILWSSIAKFDRYTQKQKKEWSDKGFIELPNQQTNQILKLNYNFLEDIEKNKKIFNLANNIRTIKIPILLIHGEKDLTVPLEEIETLIKVGRKNLTTKIIGKTGHTFGVSHPITKITRALEEALTETKKFLFNN